MQREKKDNMKSQTSLFIILLGLFLHTRGYAEMSSYDQNKPIGWATVSSTPTGGGGNGTCVTVNNATDLKSYLGKDGDYVIYIKGAIQVSSMIKAVVKNKTILGLPGSYLYNEGQTTSTSGILYFSTGSNNVIMRNVTFKSAGAYDCDGNDNLCIDAATNIWVDHCDFQDGVDGNFDCKNGSNNIAVTWCRFRYLKEPTAGGSGGAADHRYTNLWGSSDNNAAKDAGKLNTTFQFCWWGEGCRERMPRVRFGKVHIINCLYNSSVANYCCGAGNNSSIYVEKSAFIGVNNPYKDYSSSSEKGYLTFNNCYFKNCSGNTTGTGSAFTPSSYYTLAAIDASLVEGVVSNTNNGAGATLTVVECQGVIAGGNVTPNNTASLTKAGTGAASQKITINTPIAEFGYSWTNATGATVEGLPNGVYASINPDTKTITISGSPKEAGTFTYTVSTTGAETNASVSGTITVTESSILTGEPTLTKRGSGSSSQTISKGEPITSFGYSWTNATTIEFSGLPAGLNISANGTDRMDISGIPTESGVFNFTVKTIGGASELSKSGTITVTEQTTGYEEDKTEQSYIQLTSQPVKGKASLSIRANGTICIHLCNPYGKQLLYIEKEVTGMETMDIDTENFAPGIYLLDYTIGNDRYSEKMIIIK